MGGEEIRETERKRSRVGVKERKENRGKRGGTVTRGLAGRERTQRSGGS